MNAFERKEEIHEALTTLGRQGLEFADDLLSGGFGDQVPIETA